MAGFKDVIGHEQIIEHLKNAIQSKKINHAYIFNGPDGAGKKLLAESFAKTLQCVKESTDACGHCRSCKQADSHNHPDIIYLEHEKISSIGVDDIREQINGDIVIKPYSSKYKIYIVDEAEKMTVQAQNALLKTIEEPPSYAIILLLTSNSETFLPTILSRCTILNLKPVSDDKIKTYLMSAYRMPDYQADLCTAFAQGNVGKAVQLAVSQNFVSLKNELLNLLKHLDETDVYELSDSVKGIAEHKLEINDYFDLMRIWFRDILYMKATNDVNGLIFKDEVYEIKKQAEKRSYHNVQREIEALDKAKIRLNANVNFDLVIELLLFTMKEYGD